MDTFKRLYRWRYHRLFCFLVIAWFKKDKGNNKVYTFHNEKENKDVYMIALRNDEGELIGYYEKHEYRTRESMAMYDLRNGEN